jgi:low temperature requirement protein LtrA
VTAAETRDAPAPASEPAIRVSTLELFFDLVFVFTVTQFTNVLVDNLNAVGVVQALLMLVIVWWMYSGYAWLTNAVAPSSTLRRTLLLGGMGGFLVIALAAPDAFGAAGWAFGAGYLAVSLMHSTLGIMADNRGSVRAMRSLAPLNTVSALLVFVGALLPGAYRYGLWAAAVAMQVATPYLHRMASHTVVPGHFAERHGLVVIVAIGESIVAIGMGFEGLPVNLGAITVAVLGLSLAYYLWWAYFAGDDARAEHALAAETDPLRRARLALWGWGYAHVPMIFGVVVLSAGVKKTVGHAFEPLGWAPAVALAAGTALFLLGHAVFLRILHVPGAGFRVVAAAGVLATIPLGPAIAVAQLVAIPLIMAAAAIAEDLPRIRRTHSTAVHTFGRTIPDAPADQP